MLRRGFLLRLTGAIATLFAGAARAQDATQSASSSSSTSSAAPATFATQSVSLKTAKGEITLALEIERAPITAKNFLKYVDQKRLDGANFYRAMKIKDPHITTDIGLIQGGDNSRALPGCKHEPTSVTGLTHSDGVISLARGKPGTAQGDFFICLGDMSDFDAGRDGTDDQLGFAAFGHVTGGMDVVHAIFNAPVSATKGIGPMKGQMLSPPIRIVTARRIKT